MVGRKKKLKVCDKVSEEEGEDRISQLPESLISEILSHLSTKDSVRTSLLSTRWRNLWEVVPVLDLDSCRSSNFDAFVSFVERVLNSHRESWIRKLQLSLGFRHVKFDLTPWVDALTRRRIQHLDISVFRFYDLGKNEIPLSLNPCETLVHLRLCEVTLGSPEFVSFPCLKVMRLEHNRYRNETTLQKLISGCPVLEDLTILRSSKADVANVLQVRSHKLKRIEINECTQVVIDAPLLQCLRAKVSTPKNFQIVNLGISAKLDVAFSFKHEIYISSMIHDILADISRVRELVIGNNIFKEISVYSKSGPVLQFHELTLLDIGFSEWDIEMLPTVLESCPKLKSFIFNFVRDRSRRGKKMEEPKVMFSTVPQCLVSSLKFLEMKRPLPEYEGETELIRYFLKNSTILEKLRLQVYSLETAMCAFLQKIAAMPRCSSACEVHPSFIGKEAR